MMSIENIIESMMNTFGAVHFCVFVIIIVKVATHPHT